MQHPRYSIYKSRAAKCRIVILSDTDPKLPTDFASTIIHLYGTSLPIKIDPDAMDNSSTIPLSNVISVNINTSSGAVTNTKLQELFRYLQSFFASSKMKVSSLFDLYFYIFILF